VDFINASVSTIHVDNAQVLGLRQAKACGDILTFKKRSVLQTPAERVASDLSETITTFSAKIVSSSFHPWDRGRPMVVGLGATIREKTSSSFPPHRRHWIAPSI
jgi:hypothetical protein